MQYVSERATGKVFLKTDSNIGDDSEKTVRYFTFENA